MSRRLWCGVVFAALVSIWSPGQTAQGNAAVPGATQPKPDSQPSAASGSTAILDPWSLYRMGNFSAAIDGYQKLLKDDPKSADAYAGLARVYLQRKMWTWHRRRSARDWQYPIRLLCMWH
ncbi:MAG: tetratricopeptide repeat protein [Terriglobales bacterium]|jgi:tetratricopeptide (TPR) repeat protein|nr:tetratricopeptide repeat protein [Terriglobales bacterium]